MSKTVELIDYDKTTQITVMLNGYPLFEFIIDDNVSVIPFYMKWFEEIGPRLNTALRVVPILNGYKAIKLEPFRTYNKKVMHIGRERYTFFHYFEDNIPKKILELVEDKLNTHRDELLYNVPLTKKKIK